MQPAGERRAAVVHPSLEHHPAHGLSETASRTGRLVLLRSWGSGLRYGSRTTGLVEARVHARTPRAGIGCLSRGRPRGFSSCGFRGPALRVAAVGFSQGCERNCPACLYCEGTLQIMLGVADVGESQRSGGAGRTCRCHLRSTSGGGQRR